MMDDDKNKVDIHDDQHIINGGDRDANEGKGEKVN